MFEEHSRLHNEQKTNSLNSAVVVSVIIPAKNEEKYLPLCLKSLLEGDFDQEKMEIILVDNGSTDNTVSIARSFGCKVYVKPCLTIGGLRNFGVNVAQGDIIAFIDADCVADKGWIRNALAILKEDTKNVCITGLIKMPDNSSWVERTFNLTRTKSKERFEKSLVTESNTIIKKDTFLEVKGFSYNIIAGEGVDLGVKLKRNNYKIIFDKNVSVTHLDEPKTLRALFIKERWRGYNSIDIFIANYKDKKRLIAFIQIIVFTFSLLFLFIFLLSGLLLFSFSSFLLIFSLIIIRAAVISTRNKNFRYFIPLILICLIYYFSRTLSVCDWLADKLKKEIE